MKYQPVIYQALNFGKTPVKIRPEFNETDPRHADMLRYDTAFHHPTDPSLVVFPLFRDPSRGTMPDKVTMGRWSSFSITLEDFLDLSKYGTNEHVTDALGIPGVDDFGIHNIDEWITYVHSVPEYKLVRTTMADYKALYAKTKIVGYREV